ncbi:MAG: Bax inhibitor-1/YccA family protein [Bacilli bacterium]
MNNLFSKVFLWLAAGLFISFGVAFYVSTNENLVYNIFTKYYIWIIILELVLAFVLSLCITKLSKAMTIILYIGYSAVTGLTLSSVFLAYELSSIIMIFLMTSIIFALLSVYGYVTKKDVSKIGPILFFGLIGIIIVTILNIFVFKSSSFDIWISIISIIIFLGFVAYDINLIKRRMYDIDDDKLAVYGAFQLYLDFVNIFLDLLRLFGESND